MSLKDQVIAALKKVYDPEMPVNIYELGLIYGCDVDEQGRVALRMTLTAPNCPVAGSLPAEVERAVRAVAGRHGRQTGTHIRSALVQRPHVAKPPNWRWASRTSSRLRGCADEAVRQ